ncbi:MAG: hypothetical protein FWB85_08020, partial [Chitinispirillia bacterium]|nr:hypothetical protein [Chitinispirillia bacterium]MCL2242216.1 hypothetical protein [Chitinispirillia bacterium]
MGIDRGGVNSHVAREENTVSIAAANKKYAKVVSVDVAKLVDDNGDRLDLSNTSAVAKWLRDAYQGREVTIADDGQIVRFTRRGLEDGLKRRGEAQRQTYADLDRIVENSIYYSYEPGDSKHPNVDRHKVYYGAADINRHYYGVRLKVNTYEGSDVGLYKDLAVVKIKTPSPYRGGRPDSNHTSQTEGDKTLVP